MSPMTQFLSVFPLGCPLYLFHLRWLPCKFVPWMPGALDHKLPWTEQGNFDLTIQRESWASNQFVWCKKHLGKTYAKHFGKRNRVILNVINRSGSTYRGIRVYLFKSWSCCMSGLELRSVNFSYPYQQFKYLCWLLHIKQVIQLSDLILLWKVWITFSTYIIIHIYISISSLETHQYA